VSALRAVRYAMRVRLVKRTATVTVERVAGRLPFVRRTTVGAAQWQTEATDPTVLRMEAWDRGMPLVRADQRRRGVLPPTPRPAARGTERPDPPWGR